MRLYAITHRLSLPGNHTSGCLTDEETARLLALAEDWASGGVQWIQLREKDLAPAQLLDLARQLRSTIRDSGTRLLLNGPAELAAQAGFDGVHLPGAWTAEAVQSARRAYAASRAGKPVLSVACHAPEDGARARSAGADLALFAPVFEKPLPGAQPALAGQGLRALAACCQAASPIPVFALGGVHAENAADCLRAGAAGIAGIRLFLGERWRPLAQVE